MHVDRSYLNMLAPAYAVLHAQEVGTRVTNTGDAPKRDKRRQGTRGEIRQAAEGSPGEAQAHKPSSEHALDIIV